MPAGPAFSLIFTGVQAESWLTLQWLNLVNVAANAYTAKQRFKTLSRCVWYPREGQVGESGRN